MKAGTALSSCALSFVLVETTFENILGESLLRQRNSYWERVWKGWRAAVLSIWQILLVLASLVTCCPLTVIESLTNLLVGGKHAQAHISNLTTSLRFYQIMLKHVLIHSPPEVLKFTSKSVIKIFQTSCIRMAFNYLVPLHRINACSLNLLWFQFTAPAKWTFAWLEAWEEPSQHLSTLLLSDKCFKCSFGEHESSSSGHPEVYQQSFVGTFPFQFINLCS